MNKWSFATVSITATTIITLTVFFKKLPQGLAATCGKW
jgi:hypothetical protein